VKKQIFLGYETGSGEKIDIPLTHLVVSGVTQESGKTTTLEALIKRSEMKAVVFKTKIGEKGFSEGTLIPPYFKERFDWEYVVDLMESLRKEKMRFERGWIVRLCKKSDSLLSLSNNIKMVLSDEEKAKEIFGRKLNSLDQNVITLLDAYLDKILPELQVSRFSNILELNEGTNIMDLERYSVEVASLIIKSVLDTVLKEFKNTIIVIPEAWKFAPQDSGNPCKKSLISFIRQGATNGNYVYIDSQDITGTDKTPLKQISTWILGYQSEINEIKRTLDQIPLPKKSKPKTEDISRLPLGHFYVVFKDFTKKVYVQPIWLEKEAAIEIAKGEKAVEEIKRPEALVPFKIEPDHERGKPTEPIVELRVIKDIEKKVIQTRTDFFDKITQIQEMISNLSSELLEIKSTPKEEADIDEIVSLVLQKMPLNNLAPINEEAIINKVMERIPKNVGTVTYEVAPLEKIRKDFMEEAKNKILSDIKTLDEEQKKILKFVETQEKGCNQTMILSKCLFVSATSGGTRSRVSQKCKDMANLEIMRMDKNAVCYPHLKERIKILLGTHQASDQEIEQIYSHIMMEML